MQERPVVWIDTSVVPWAAVWMVMALQLAFAGCQADGDKNQDAVVQDTTVQDQSAQDQTGGDVVELTCLQGDSPSTQSLDGPWHFSLDPEMSGEASGWSSALQPSWPQRMVPDCFNTEKEDNFFYEGRAWYQRTFEWSGAQEGRVWLVFGAVGLRGTVWLNGQLLGEHKFGHTAFEFDVTDQLKEGTNLVSVAVDNTILEKAVPDKEWNGWWNYAGIHRSVRLETRPELFVKSLWMDTKLTTGGTWEASFVAQVSGSNSGEKLRLTFQLQPLGEGCEPFWAAPGDVAESNGATSFEASASFSDVSPWTPDSPALYQLVATLERDGATVHRQAIRTGFRHIRTEGSQLLLNGQPLFLKGANRHEMHPQYGFALPDELQRADLEDIKALGSNTVRLSHYPQSQVVYDICDELGLIVYTEIPAWHTDVAVLSDPVVEKEWIEPQLAEMVAQYRHHPSVMIWGIANEFASDKPEGRVFVENAVNFLRELDDTRLITFASDRHVFLPHALPDICLDLVDIICINEYYGWYYGSMQSLAGVLDALHGFHPDKPIVVSEFGSETIPGLTNPAPDDGGMDDFSEDFQLKFLGTHLDQILDPSRSAFMAGALIWVYADFRDPHRIDDGRPEEYNYINMKGLVTMERERKRSWELIYDYFR